MEFGSYDDRTPRKMRARSRSLEPGKALVQKILDTLPDDATLEAIQYHIDLRQKIEQGWEADRPISLEERLANWRTKWSNRAWSSAR
jgi:predicted metal-dependent phosphoesterase TrpH